MNKAFSSGGNNYRKKINSIIIAIVLIIFIFDRYYLDAIIGPVLTNLLIVLVVLHLTLGIKKTFRKVGISILSLFYLPVRIIKKSFGYRSSQLIAKDDVEKKNRKTVKAIVTLQPYLKFIVIILFAIGLMTAFFYYLNRKDNCVNPYEVKDTSSRKEIVRICDNTLYRGSIKIVNDKEFPDFFRFYLNKDSKPENVVQYVRVSEFEKQEYVTIKSVIDYTSWIDSSIGIYHKDGNKYNLIFKKTFSDNWGRWVNIDFGEDYTTRDTLFYLSSHGEGFTISGDLGYLGCLGACRMLWWDYYDWDASKKTFVLVNNKHVENFKELLKDYEDVDKNKCSWEVNVSESITALYPLRKNKEKLCSDDAVQPYTTPGQAEMLLKGIKAIKMIINGENIPMSMVGSIQLD